MAIFKRIRLTKAEWKILAAHALLFCSVITPFMFHEVLPLADYPNHLARIFIMRHPDLFNSVYEVHYRLSPYILSDAALHFFALIFDIYTAGKAYFIFTFFLITAGVILVSRHIHGQISWVTLCSHMFVFSAATLMGFLNFLFGIGIALISFYAWLRLRSYRYSLIFLSLILIFNFFTHVLSFVALVLLIGAYECLPLLKNVKALSARALQIFVSCVPCFILLPFVLEGHLHLDPATLPAHPASVIFFNTIASPRLFTGYVFEFLSLFLFVLMFALSYFKIGKYFISPVILLLILACFAPFWLFGVGFINIRLPVFIAFLTCAVAGLSNKLSREFYLFGSLMLVSFSFSYLQNVNAISSCGAGFDKFIADIRAAPIVAHQPIKTFMGDETNGCELYPAYEHLNLATVIENHLFSPNLFVVVPPIVMAEKFSDLGRKFRKTTPDRFFQKEAENGDLKSFRYILRVNIRPDDEAHYKDLAAVAKGSFYVMYENKAYVAPSEMR